MKLLSEKEIARRLDITQQRVSQLLKIALKKLKERYRDDNKSE